MSDDLKVDIFKHTPNLDSEEDPSLPMRVVAFNFEGTR
jgi:hypothetical protein